MGLRLRYYLFYGVASGDVGGALQAFYAVRGRPLQKTLAGTVPSDLSLYIYTADNNWVVVELDSGWEWKERREAQLFVSERLYCPSLLIFVYDGDYWGYEFLDQGKVLDHFVQQQDQADQWFPGQDCSGKPEVLVQHLPFLNFSVIAPYLKQKPSYGNPPELKGKVHPHDEFDRFDECAVLDFLRALGVRVGLQDGYVMLNSSLDFSLEKA